MQTKVGICSKACSGNPHETCGGLGSIHVFGPPPSSNKWISRGCYSDWVDTIPDGFVHFSTATLNGTAGRLGLMGMTNWECKLKCAQSGFVFAGTEMGSECYCGNEIMNDGKKVGDDECNYQCVGDPTDQCGGYTRVSVFQLVNN